LARRSALSVLIRKRSAPQNRRSGLSVPHPEATGALIPDP